MRPLEKPMIRILPSNAMHFRERSKVSPPTESKMTFAPRPPLSRRTTSAKSSLR